MGLTEGSCIVGAQGKEWGANRKKVRRVIREQGLMATQTVHKAKRTPQRSKPMADTPRQYWGIDMAKLVIPGLGWVYWPSHRTGIRRKLRAGSSH